MWHTSKGGVRILEGIEAEFFCRCAGYLLMLADMSLPFTDDDTEVDEDILQIGPVSFNELTFGQKVFAMDEVIRALLLRDVPAPLHNAYNEATVLTIYLQGDCVADKEPGDFSRLALLAYCDEDDDEGNGCGPRQREEVIEHFTDSVLWDRDFDLQVVNDMSEGDRAEVAKVMGIDRSYFTEIPEECKTVSQMRTMIGELISLVDGTLPGETDDDDS